MLPLFVLMFSTVPVHAAASSIGTLFQATNVTFTSSHHLEFDSSVDLTGAYQMHICVINTDCGTLPNYYWNSYNPTCSATHCSADFTGPYVSDVGVTSVYIAVYPCDACALNPWPYSSQTLAYPFQPALQGVSVSVTPTTPMWKLDVHVTLDPSQVVCPAALTVTLQASGKEAATTPDICKGQATAPAQTDIYVPVFNTQNANDLPLVPLASAVVTVQLTDANQQSSSLTGNAAIPPAPIWVGLGDSFASGWHQGTRDPYYCYLVCGVVRNDLAYSWLSSAVAQLNTTFSVPSVWQMTADLEARGGSPSMSIVTNQVPNMVSQLTSHKESWNVVSTDGGAIDTGFGQALNDFYSNKQNQKNQVEPWVAPKQSVDCVNTEVVWQNLQQQSATILSNLEKIVAAAHQADPDVRVATVDYPYLLDQSNICENDHFITIKGKSVLQHGAADVIDGLHSLYTQIPNNQAVLVDLGPVFTTSPLQYIQLTSVWGYPHPNQSGQQSIATAVATAILGL